MACILIVDDDAPVRRTLEKILSKQGYEVVVAADGREGAMLFRHRRPDLVITDLIMPNQEGLGMIARIRAEDPGARIIAISGGGRVGNTDFLKMARMVGAMETMAKPFAMDDILARVRRCLEAGADEEGTT